MGLSHTPTIQISDFAFNYLRVKSFLVLDDNVLLIILNVWIWIDPMSLRVQNIIRMFFQN